ncbi:MAG TPA: threonine synthase [Flavisolibacter sp.]|jgi:threonine synthase|nr:threonine synthase [Flavisolibacter sp.]
MNYFSTNNPRITVSFRQAVIEGQPEDRGLYFPTEVPLLGKALFTSLKSWSREDLGYHVMRSYAGADIPEPVLQKIVAETVNFPFPLVQVSGNIASLELFHGPTLAFKDVGARFMSRCLSYFAGKGTKKYTVLVATSGDTGGAVADAFHEVENVNVVILYPSGKVSEIQELQLTTLGGNVTALEIQGNFDDCQRLVKQAFSDKDLKVKLQLTSANSINVARWLPQQLYYFYALQQWTEEESPVISVPSGNFGNICAGLLARQSGLPVNHFIAACNMNDIVMRYLQTGTYLPEPARHTLSNAMDVGDPSNFIRIQQLFDRSIDSLKKAFSCCSISDEETIQVMKAVEKEFGYILDPHGAVGYLALERFLATNGGKGLFLETAHPVKFEVDKILGKEILRPDAIRLLMGRSKSSITLPPDFASIKDYLLQE